MYETRDVLESGGIVSRSSKAAVHKAGLATVYMRTNSVRMHSSSGQLNAAFRAWHEADLRRILHHTPESQHLQHGLTPGLEGREGTPIDKERLQHRCS